MARVYGVDRDGVSVTRVAQVWKGFSAEAAKVRREASKEIRILSKHLNHYGK